MCLANPSLPANPIPLFQVSKTIWAALLFTSLTMYVHGSCVEGLCHNSHLVIVVSVQKVHLLAQDMVIFSQPCHLFFNFLSRRGNNVHIWENTYNLNL